MRAEERNELGIGAESRIGPQVRGDLLSLILKNQSSRGFHGVVMCQRQINGLIKTDQRSYFVQCLPASAGGKHRSQGENPKIPGAHKG